MNTIPTTGRTRKATFDVGIPLHAETDSATDVAQLVGTLLNDISRFDRQTSHSDVLQALAITTAVRMAMADAAETPGIDFSMELLDVGVDSDAMSATYAA